MLFIFAEVLRTNVFYLIELFVVFLLQCFAMSRRSIRYLQNVVFYLVSLGSYLSLKLVFQLMHSSLEGVSVLWAVVFYKLKLLDAKSVVEVNLNINLIPSSWNFILKIFFCLFKTSSWPCSVIDSWLKITPYLVQSRFVWGKSIALLFESFTDLLMLRSSVLNELLEFFEVSTY